MRRWIVTAVVAVALVAGGVGWAATRSTASTTRYLTALVARGTVAQTVAATGTVQPAATLALGFAGTAAASAATGSTSSGTSSGTATTGTRTVSNGATTVTSVSAKAGQRVAAGAVLATVDPAPAQAQLTAAQAQLTAAQARRAAEPAGASQATVDADAAAIAQAEQQVQSAEVALAATVLKAPVAGMVTAVSLTAGLPPTTPAVTMQSGGLAVVASVSENDVGSLQPGQPATVTFPALSVSTPATLGAMPTAANSASGTATSAVTFPVTLNLPRPPARLLPGMTVQISIVIARRDNVLYVPTTAIQGTANSPSVQVLRNGKPLSVPVEIGLSTSSTTEIVAGLSVGQTVVTGVVNPAISTTPGIGGGGLGGRGGLGGGGLRGGGLRGGGGNG